MSTLLWQGIEPGGRVDRDGRLAVGDEITHINNSSLSEVSFAKAQEIFKEALFAKELKLLVLKGVDDFVASTSVSGSSGAKQKNMENKENLDVKTESEAANTSTGGEFKSIFLKKSLNCL